MPRNKKKRSTVVKPKRATPAQQRVGIKTISIEPADLGPNYKARQPKRHRGTSGAVPGTSNSRRRDKKK